MDKIKTTKKVVSFGDLVADIITYIPTLPAEAGKHQIATKVQIEPGGAGNFLIAGARIGLEMFSLGVLGKDTIGDAVLKIFEVEEINLGGILLQPDGRTTSVVVLADQSGQHVFLGEVGSGPIVELSDKWKEIIQGCDAFQAWGYTFHEERLESAMREAILYAKSLNKPVFFDPGPFMGDASPEQRNFVLQNCTVILMTEDEVPFLTNGKKDIDFVQELLAFGPKMICVKRGPEGSVILTEDHKYEHQGYKVEVVDTSAAGDSFDAAFIYAFLQGWHPEKICAFANAMGAAKVQKLGSGRQVPTAVEVNDMLRKNNAGFKI
ncbi:MAG: carbohydrate kinase family protein [Anaerolineaceae bacterium]|nr:carbohydrate kinase family protein [Anaerolineaceae bacterium]